MLISKSIGGEPTEPKYFWNIFEVRSQIFISPFFMLLMTSHLQRGIDPHVDDPDHCHNHSEVPDKDEDWPTIESVIGFRNGARQRLLSLYEDVASGKRALSRNIARTLVMTYEHEGFHVEVRILTSFTTAMSLMPTPIPDYPVHADPESRLRYPPTTWVYPSRVVPPRRTMGFYAPTYVFYCLHPEVNGDARPSGFRGRRQGRLERDFDAQPRCSWTYVWVGQ